jgi:hypothetical protein
VTQQGQPEATPESPPLCGRFVTSRFLEPDSQEALNHGVNWFGALLLCESLEDMPDEMQAGGLTVVCVDHKGKTWYLTATTTEPELVPVPAEKGDPH